MMAKGILCKNSRKLSGFWVDCMNLKEKISSQLYHEMYPVGFRRLRECLGD